MSNNPKQFPIPRKLNRRRAITIMGAAAGAALMPRGAGARASSYWQDWSGVVMGADSSIKLLGPDGEKSGQLVAACLKEARRLEALFSLHDKTSAISRLNAQGFLDNPDADFLRLLEICNSIHGETAGAFDATVQPLWRLYGNHFLDGGTLKSGADPRGPARDKIDAALKLVDQSAITISSKRIEFSQPSMAITLNGIAQGYITDKIAELLRHNGIDRVFVDMGEPRGLGLSNRNEPWQVGLVNPRDVFHLAGLVELEDLALATSGAYGLEFDKSGRFHHILDPKSGASTARNLSVSVMARSAALADGLSTAFSGMDARDVSRVVASHKDVGAIITDLNGRHIKSGNLPKMILR